MKPLLRHLATSLRLHFRNRMALLYGYLFPLIFLVAFWVLYRHEKVPLLRHMGELLTVSVLGGACFGLPTTLVSERERGVWRRYRLTPVPTWVVVASTTLARYVLVLGAGLLQLGFALAMGMTWPAHPLDLWVAFTFVAFAFIGLGLVIATLADNVPAVQALGQCLFLPMLIIGGVAVPLVALPDWAQHISAFFPGRYAVDAIQLCVTGGGLETTRFSLLALTVIGLAGVVAGAKLFRWDAQQHFRLHGGKAWLLSVLASWIGIGLLAESRGHVKVTAVAEAAPSPAVGSTTVASSAAAPVAATPRPASVPSNASAAAAKTAVPVAPAPTPEPPWSKITDQDVAALDFNVPPDQGIVAPFADKDEEVPDFIAQQIATARERLPTWEPGLDDDELQALRNLLCVAAVPDVVQLPAERYMPRVVFDFLKERFPKEKLIKMLTWIAMNPERGMVLDDMTDLGIEGQAGDPNQVRERMYLYAIKFIARLTGRVDE